MRLCVRHGFKPFPRSPKPLFHRDGGVYPNSLRIFELSTTSDPRSLSTASDLPVRRPANFIKYGGKENNLAGRPNAEATLLLSSGVEASYELFPFFSKLYIVGLTLKFSQGFPLQRDRTVVEGLWRDIQLSRPADGIQGNKSLLA